MNILIVGLGLIGGSYAMRLKKAGHKIYGVDVKQSTLDYALSHNMCDAVSLDASEFITISDLIIIGLYPDHILEFLESYHSLFNSKQVITDVCGVKSAFIHRAIKLASPAIYISHHPMAGREKSGIEYADNKIFDGMNFLIVNVENKEYEINILKQIGHDLGFGRISLMSPKYHDKMIGFTSQLTHAIAVSLVNSDTEDDTKNFIGDSYRDLTRIAMINENLWSDLFFANREYLLSEITNFESELLKLKLCLVENNKEGLKEIFIKSKNKRKEMEK